MTGPSPRYTSPCVALAAAAVLAVLVAAGLGADSAGAGPAPAGVQILGVEPSQAPGYAPGRVDIAPGGSVRWTYADPNDLKHSVTAKDKSFDSGKLTSASPPFLRLFPVKGRFAYTCTFHERTMNGVVRVGGTAVSAGPLAGTHGAVRKGGKRFAKLGQGAALGFEGTVRTLAVAGGDPTGTVTIEGFKARSGRKLRFSGRAAFRAAMTAGPAGTFSGALPKRPKRGLYRVRFSYGGDASHLDSASRYRYLSVG